MPFSPMILGSQVACSIGRGEFSAPLIDIVCFVMPSKFATGGRGLKVRALLKLLMDDGWRLGRTRGSHRQFVHSTKPGTVTVSGHPNDDIHPKTLKSVLRQAGLENA